MHGYSGFLPGQHFVAPYLREELVRSRTRTSGAAATAWRSRSRDHLVAEKVASDLGRNSQNLGAGARDVGIDRLAAGHGSEAALLDHVAALPAAGLRKGVGLHNGIGLRPEPL